MRHARPPLLTRLLLGLGLSLGLATGCPPPPDPLEVNHAPVARVVLPQLWPASEPVVVDGTLSSDEDGDALRFAVDWGDGTPSAADEDGVVEHSYAAPSTYAVQLTVEDEGGVPTSVQASVVVVGDDDAGCTCDLGCFDDAVCTADGCLIFRSSDQEELEAPEGALEPLSCP